MDRLYRDNLALRFSLDDWMVDVSLGGDSPQRLIFQRVVQTLMDPQHSPSIPNRAVPRTPGSIPSVSEMSVRVPLRFARMYVPVGRCETDRKCHRDRSERSLGVD